MMGGILPDKVGDLCFWRVMKVFMVEVFFNFLIFLFFLLRTLGTGEKNDCKKER